LVNNGFLERRVLDGASNLDWFMELWTNFICSWVGSTTCSFTEILKKEYIVTNLEKTWEEEFLNKEDIWEPICIELEKKYLEQRRDGYPFVENLRTNFHDKSSD